MSEFQDFLNEQLQDSEFKNEYDKFKPQEKINTLSDYLEDETRVTQEEQKRIKSNVKEIARKRL